MFADLAWRALTHHFTGIDLATSCKTSCTRQNESPIFHKKKKKRKEKKKKRNFYHIIELSFLEPKSVEHLVKVHNICKLSLFSNTPLLTHSILQVAHFHYPFLYHRLHIDVSRSNSSRKNIVSAYHQVMVIVLKTGLLQTSPWRMEHRRW